MCDRQLQYSRPLAALEMRHENDVSVWQFERVMMSVSIVLIYLAKSSNSEVGGLRPKPALIVCHVLIKSQFGSRKQANRHVPFPFRRKAAGPS
jgi:adenylosuccinate lyase